MNRLLKWVMDPRVATVLFLIFLIGYFIFLDEEGGLDSSGFFLFGPSSDPNINFLGVQINSWSKVITLYTISFVSALMSGYYDVVLSSNFMEKLVDPELVVPWSTPVVFGITSMDKVIGMGLEIINILIISSRQFQFMVPAVLADLAIGFLEANFLLSQKMI
jgi:hypothetical protein